MNPHAVNRVAIVAAVSATVFAVAVGSRMTRCQVASPAMTVPAQVAVTEERAAVEMAQDEARAEAEAQRAAELTEAAAQDVEAMDREEELNKIRQAAKDFVKHAAPDAKSDGVFLLPLYQESLFIAGVDTQLPDGRRRTIDLLVRRYVRKGSNNYWRAESLDGSQKTLVETSRSLAPYSPE